MPKVVANIQRQKTQLFKAEKQKGIPMHNGIGHNRVNILTVVIINVINYSAQCTLYIQKDGSN